MRIVLFIIAGMLSLEAVACPMSYQCFATLSDDEDPIAEFDINLIEDEHGDFEGHYDLGAVLTTREFSAQIYRSGNECTSRMNINELYESNGPNGNVRITALLAGGVVPTDGGGVSFRLQGNIRDLESLKFLYVHCVGR